MATPEPAHIGTGKTAVATHIERMAMAQHGTVIIVDTENCVQATASAGMTRREKLMVEIKQLCAVLEDKNEYVVITDQAKEYEKDNWNRNTQRNLRHHPGKRWIDLRTMNK